MNLHMSFWGGIGSKIRVWKFMQIVFRPKWSFVKSVPGDELLDVVEAPVEDGDVALVAIARSGAENSETDVTILKMIPTKLAHIKWRL
jgi:hypothetical protein